MPGVFITEGMGLRIPAGGLVISLDGGDSPPVIIETNLDMYPAWLDIAQRNLVQAGDSHQQLLEAISLEDDTMKGAALNGEMAASLVAISASAFALDAFYARILDFNIIPDSILDAWKANRTRRPARIAETLKRAFSPPGVRWAAMRRDLETVFRFRDWAVHPPSEFRQPVLHPDLHAGVDWRFFAFREANAMDATLIALHTLAWCLANPRDKDRDFRNWAEGASERLQTRVDDWKTERGDSGWKV